MVFRIGKEFIIFYQNICKDIMVISIIDIMIIYLIIWRLDGLCCVVYVFIYFNISNVFINEYCQVYCGFCDRNLKKMLGNICQGI